MSNQEKINRNDEEEAKLSDGYFGLFFTLQQEMSYVSGTGEGFDTVTVGTSTPGHTDKQMLCLGPGTIDSRRPTSTPRVLPSVLICVAGDGVTSVTIPAGIQSLARLFVSIPNGSNTPSRCVVTCLFTQGNRNLRSVGEHI
jgi:hypothetical protein